MRPLRLIIVKANRRAQGQPQEVTQGLANSLRKNQLRSLASFASRFTGDEDPRDPKRDLRTGGR